MNRGLLIQIESSHTADILLRGFYQSWVNDSLKASTEFEVRKEDILYITNHVCVCVCVLGVESGCCRKD